MIKTYRRGLSRISRVMLLTIVFAAVICAIACLVFTAVGDMRDEADSIDDARATHAATAAIRSFKSRLAATVRDNAFWDDALTHMGSADGPEWAYENWGKTSKDYPLYDAEVVITMQGNVLSAYRKGFQFDALTYFGNSLNGQARQAFASPQTPVTAFVSTVDGLYLLSTGIIQPFSGLQANSNHSALIFAKLLTDDVVAKLAETFDISGLKLVASPHEDQLSMPLLGGDGRAIAYFEWPSRTPGTQIYNVVYHYLMLAGFLFVSFFIAIVATAAAIVCGLKRDAATARFRAQHDGLTGLLNRAGLLEVIEENLVSSADRLALALVDLDGFKDVNDAWGHAVGDELIRLVADRMSAAVPGGSVTRLGGDEFAFLSLGQQIQDKSMALVAALQQPLRIGGRTIEVGASVGTALVDADVSDGLELLRRADMALYEAKESGRGRVVSYSAALDAQRLQRVALEEKLRRAIADKQVRPLFQPLIDAKTGSLRGVEALARWVPETGPISPEVFIVVAERAGLIDELGKQILDMSVAQASRWEGIGLSVNVSPVQLRNPDYALSVEKSLESAGFDPRRLTLEITEGVLMSNPDQAKRAIAKLKAIGVKFALDDFGCGYASIGALREFGFDRMKIDRSLVTALDDEKGAGVLNATLSLAQALHIPVTAEGVETQAQADALIQAGCDQLQGYFLGKPMSSIVLEQTFLAPAA